MQFQINISEKLKKNDSLENSVDNVLIFNDKLLFSDYFVLYATISFTLIIIVTISIFISQFRQLGSNPSGDQPRIYSQRSDSLVPRNSTHDPLWTELYDSADKCFIEKYALRCEEIVRSRPELINRGSAITGQTPFHRICFHGQTSLVRSMLEKGAIPRLNSDAGESPLCLAIYFYLKNNRFALDEPVSCLDVLSRAGCRLFVDDIWYDLLLELSIRAGNKSLTKWIIVNGEFQTTRKNFKNRQKSEPPYRF